MGKGLLRCRELWYRASLALTHMLSQPSPPSQTAAASGNDATQRSTSLVVAHNAVNQAVLCVALGLPPSRFRTLVQCNAATSWLRFQSDGNATLVTLLHLNQSPDVLTEVMAGEATAGQLRIVIVTGGSLSAEAATATAAVLSPLQVSTLDTLNTPNPPKERWNQCRLISAVYEFRCRQRFKRSSFLAGSMVSVAVKHLEPTTIESGYPVNCVTRTS